MSTEISQQTKHELLGALRDRYAHSSKLEKTKILDEFVVVARCHRKHAIRLLVGVDPLGHEAPTPARRIYSEATREALIVLWEAADRICGKRLKAILPDLIAAMERHGHLALDPIVRQHLLTISPATIDRLLAPIRGVAGRRRKRKRSTESSRQIPIRTFADWSEPLPGFLEVDFVSHGGESTQGAFLWSLVATDVCSGWTEAVPLLAREQSLVIEGLAILRRQFPVPIRGIDTDNDSAFINEALRGYCREEHLEFTRSRAYQKNDQAWIEQKNGSVVRRFVGDRRLSGLVAGQCLATIYKMMRLYVNYFQPSFKLLSKTREGAKVKKRYHKPATPCDRLLAHAGVSAEAKGALRTELASLDPLEILHQIREGQAALAALSSGDPGHGPERESLEAFLAKLPGLWREGEARPTHRSEASSPRTWRTRKDPFEAVWPEILLWLQQDPEATAKSLMERLQRDYPGRFAEGQLRTLQRRIHEWRRVTARSLVHGCLVGNEATGDPVVVRVERQG
ncbi:MAG TPA: transposase family protein [Chloroflexota bacterium]|nr:transposase family protein [Chloroflexota bacterium]